MSNSNGLLRDIRAIIFDLDGVILESGDIKTQAFLDLFAEYPEHSEKILEYHLANLGVSRYDKFAWIYRELLHEPLSASERARLGQAFSDLVLEKVLNCPFVPGAREALENLHESKLLFVASGTPQEELDVILERRGIAKFFRGAWGSPLKKPQIVEGVLEKYQLARDAVLFVGDGSSDYDAARETGVRFVARETAEMNGHWQRLKVASMGDLTSFAGVLKTAVVREEVLRDPRYPVHQIADRLLPYLNVLVEQFHPHQVILFGSYAYGQPNRHSDVDLLIIKDLEQSPLREAIAVRSAWRKMQREDIIFPFDLIVISPVRHRERLAKAAGFYDRIVEKGLTIV